MIEKPKRVNRPEKCGWYAIDLEDGVIVTRSVPMYKWSEAKAEAWDLDAKFIGYYDGVSWDDIELTSRKLPAGNAVIDAALGGD